MPAGKVENGIISGLDWFPTFVAAAGNPNIVDELKAGKQLGDKTYKVHLDGYNQMDLITGKGPSKRNEIFYFTESTLGAVRINDFKYRFTDQPDGWLGATVKVDWPILVNLRLDPFERTGMSNGKDDGSIAYYNWFAYEFWRFVFVQQEVGEAGADRHRVPADAEGRELQPGSGQGADRGRHRPQENSHLSGLGARVAVPPRIRHGGAPLIAGHWNSTRTHADVEDGPSGHVQAIRGKPEEGPHPPTPMLLVGALALSLFTGGATAYDVTSGRTKLGTIPEFHPELGLGALQGYLDPKALPNSLALIPPPPAPGSAAFALDVEIAQNSFALRDTPRFALAASDFDLKLPHFVDDFSCALNVQITKENAPYLYTLLCRSFSDIGLSTYAAKNYYKRTRPFQQNGATPRRSGSPRLPGEGSFLSVGAHRPRLGVCPHPDRDCAGSGRRDSRPRPGVRREPHRLQPSLV